MNKCPSCGADTRPGDNFCLGCGNRLFPAASSSQQGSMIGGDATIPGPDNWGTPMGMATIPAAAPGGWSESDDKTIAADVPEELPTLRADAGDVQLPLDSIENPARFVGRTLESSASQEYLLDKRVMTIGRVPESDICFPEDKLVSRTHATIRYENGGYTLRDEGSANGTLLNSQELPKMTDQGLRDGDIILIGDQELTFRTAAPVEPGIEEGETVIISLEAPAAEATQADEDATLVGSDPLETRTMEYGGQPAASSATTAEPPAPPEVTPVESSAEPAPEVPPPPPQTPIPQTGVTVNSFASLARPSLPEIAPLLAASATLEQEITLLQQQLGTAQEATRNHEAEIAQRTDQLRTAMRRLAERMDNTIVGVARSRDEQNWDDLLRLIQDTISKPRDIGNAMELARRAVEVDKVLQVYQGVLNTLAECNSLLRGLIGEEKH
jgi:pSer/pThr/pTyr-binding forkhead associated (FHA) protein